MHNIIAILKKQVKDTLKNKTVLIQFVMFPVMTLVMNPMIKIEGMPGNFFVNLFATMYVGMAPLTSMAAIMSEEKEKNTLRVLLMSNVRPYEYLLGIGGYVLVACMLGAALICMAGEYTPGGRAAFMGIMAIGIVTSLLAGAAIGTFGRTQMMATSITVPVMLVVSFLPMLAQFNETVARVAKFAYSQQISLMLGQIGGSQPVAGFLLGGVQSSGSLATIGGFPIEGACILVGNIALIAAAFTMAYKKCGLE